MYDATKYDVPEHLIDSLNRYAQQHTAMGSFLMSVVSNDLMEAMGRADIDNRYKLFDICSYIYNELPGPCHGSKEKVEQWLKLREINNVHKSS